MTSFFESRTGSGKRKQRRQTMRVELEGFWQHNCMRGSRSKTQSASLGRRLFKIKTMFMNAMLCVYFTQDKPGETSDDNDCAIEIKSE